MELEIDLSGLRAVPAMREACRWHLGHLAALIASGRFFCPHTRCREHGERLPRFVPLSAVA